ncbi:hypothetical protein [Cellulomonas sp. GbtcB1]|uniref:hypothetical protein n=1 Tax=Cellulomonas sp. GbtcB1 TaxID=2824746 RepID=UPI001C30A3A4|nr:hypothetical protein [Cellulomonas sp. GbtcB1]
MSMDFGRALRDLTTEAERVAHPVDVRRIQTRMHRRRARRVTLQCIGGVAVIGAVGTGVGLLADGLPEDHRPALPSTPAPRVPTCGEEFVLSAADHVDFTVHGSVAVGVVDERNGSFQGTSTGDALYVDVFVEPDGPSGPLGAPDRSAVTTVLVDSGGTVAFRSDQAQQLEFEATDGSGATAVDGLYDAADCRTDAPLDGTYRTYAVGTDPRTGRSDVVQLAPVSFELGAGQQAGQWPSLVPTCGRAAPDDLIAGRVTADFDVALESSAGLDDLRGGLSARATVTATTPEGRLVGTVPQTLHAVLVDHDGTVVSQVYDPTRQDYDSGATFDVGAGESFPAEVYQWFASCPDSGSYETVPSGSYTMYVYSVILASDGPGASPSPKIAVGGPYAVTLQ